MCFRNKQLCSCNSNATRANCAAHTQPGRQIIWKGRERENEKKKRNYNVYVLLKCDLIFTEDFTWLGKIIGTFNFFCKNVFKMPCVMNGLVI